MKLIVSYDDVENIVNDARVDSKESGHPPNDTPTASFDDKRNADNDTANAAETKHVKIETNVKNEDQEFAERIAYAVAIGCSVVVVITYLGLIAHAIYESIYHKNDVSEVDIFSAEFIKKQKKIFAIEEAVEEKNKNAKISFETIEQIQYANRENPLALPELIKAFRKKLIEADALEQGKRKNGLKKRRRKKL